MNLTKLISSFVPVVVEILPDLFLEIAIIVQNTPGFIPGDRYHLPKCLRSKPSNATEFISVDRYPSLPAYEISGLNGMMLWVSFPRLKIGGISDR